MVSAAVLQAVAACVLPLTVAVGPAASDLPLALIFAAGMGVTAGRVFVDAAAFGATARLVGDEHFVEGQANLSLVWSLGFLIGPALGGGLIGLVGAVEALWVEAAGFALAAVLLASIRTELGREIRSAFVAEPGWKLVSADYSQIELRILAHLSGDAALIKAFADGQDIHRITAAKGSAATLALATTRALTKSRKAFE
jgi:MFS family permease